MKKMIVLFFALLLVFESSLMYSIQKELFLKLPVRVIAGSESPGNYLKDLNKNDFELRINGEKKPIVDFSRKKRSIGDISSGHGRQFVLSFDAVDYAKPLADTVSHFVHRVLTPSDQLMVCSPLHTYRINTESGKEEVIQYIETKLEEDILQRKKDKAASFDNLDKLIENLEKKLDAKKAGIRSVLFFINHYTNEWRKFDEAFLLSNLEQYLETASLLAEKSGEKWLIHFQERDLVPMLARYQKISEKIKKHVSTFPESYRENVALIRTSLEKIEKSMLFSGDFPMEELLNGLLGVNISYNVVFFRSQAEGDQHQDSVSPGYERILKDISRRSGGISISTSNINLPESLETITRHVDVYYELVFSFAGEPEDKNIEINLTPAHAGVYYKNRFKKEELKWLLDWVQEEITLSGFVLEGHGLDFAVSGFKMKQMKDDRGEAGLIGMIKVEIRLIDDKNTTVYETGNTLKAKDKSFKVSLNLPSKIKGYFKLSIRAIDLVGNRSCQLNKYVKI